VYWIAGVGGLVKAWQDANGCSWYGNWWHGSMMIGSECWQINGGRVSSGCLRRLLQLGIDDGVAYSVVLMPCVSDGLCIGIYEKGY
jgi:hypothetical protein